MKQYDYLIVGSGLFGSVFAHEATNTVKVALLSTKEAISAEIFIARILRA